MTNFTWVPVYNRVEKIYFLLLARRAPVSEPIYRFDDKFHLGARVQSSREDLFSPTRAPGTRQRTDLSV